MLDFKNAQYLKMHLVNNDTYSKVLSPLLIEDEEIVYSYKSVRDGVVFTTKRAIAVNVQGVTGKKKSISCLPYKKVQAFEIESSGVFDLDCELELYFSNLGKVRFEFLGNTDVFGICRLISEEAVR